MVGPFWCQRDSSWIRFVFENDRFWAEVAPTSLDDPQRTEAWERREEGSWPTSYEAGHPEECLTFYALHAGALHKTQGKIAIGRLIIARCKDPDLNWSQHLIHRDGSPFKDRDGNPLREGQFNPNDVFKPEEGLLPYDHLPLTPDMFEERRRRQEEEAARKWQEIQEADVRSNACAIVVASTVEDSPFNLDALSRIYDEINFSMRFSPTDSRNCAEYLQQLKRIIEDKNHPRHQAIVREASRTYINSDNGFPIDGETNRALFKFKTRFFFNVLREEARILSQRFGIDCPADQLEERENAQNVGAASSRVNEISSGGGSQDGEEDRNIQLAIQLSLASDGASSVDRPQQRSKLGFLNYNAPRLQPVIENPSTNILPFNEIGTRADKGPRARGTCGRTKVSGRIINKAQFNALYAELKAKMESLIELGGDSRKDSFHPAYKKVAKEAKRLRTSLDEASKQYFAGAPTEESFIKFRGLCLGAVKLAKEEFGKHRGWGGVNIILRIIVGLFAGATVTP